MPYIKEEDRKRYDEHLEKLLILLRTENEANLAGCLNYCISTLTFGLAKTTMRYFRLNALMGALECAKQELYRRMAAPYEDQKIQDNGDMPACLSD